MTTKDKAKSSNSEIDDYLAHVQLALFTKPSGHRS